MTGKIEPTFVNRPAFIVVGVKYHGKNENNEISQIWDWEFLPRVKEIPSAVHPEVSYGVEGNFDEETGVFDYVAGVEVSDADDIPEGMAVWEVPENTYAVFPCSLRNLGETLEWIQQSWFPESEYQLAAGPMFEYYDTDFDPIEQTMAMYVPVTKS